MRKFIEALFCLVALSVGIPSRPEANLSPLQSLMRAAGYGSIVEVQLSDDSDEQDFDFDYDEDEDKSTSNQTSLFLVDNDGKTAEGADKAGEQEEKFDFESDNDDEADFSRERGVGGSLRKDSRDLNLMSKTTKPEFGVNDDAGYELSKTAQARVSWASFMSQREEDSIENDLTSTDSFEEDRDAIDDRDDKDDNDDRDDNDDKLDRDDKDDKDDKDDRDDKDDKDDKVDKDDEDAESVEDMLNAESNSAAPLSNWTTTPYGGTQA